MSKRWSGKRVTGRILEQRPVDFFNASNIKEMPLAKKRSLAKALSQIYKESKDKEYLIRTSNGAHSTAEQHYEKVQQAPARLTKKGEED